MRDLAYSLKQLTIRNKDGSYSNRAGRERMLSLMARQLYEEGFYQLDKAEDLKGRHVNALIERWQRESLSIGTIKNRMAVLRWWAEKVGRSSIMARDNANYGIENRQYVTNISKARVLEHEKWSRVGDPLVKLSLELQAQFGLRKEEAIKFQVAYADKGDRIVVKPSWAKGGRPREVLIRNQAQRELLDRIKSLRGARSLIPRDKMYVQQMRRFEYQTNKVGLCKMHGLRHQYAQTRYQELTGRLPPALGGKTSSELTEEEKQQDTQARLTISEEMGHSREPVTAIYLGR